METTGVVAAGDEHEGERPRPLFFVGNKRSGTSQLVRLLNLHSRVFVSHESDILWILHLFHAGEPYRPHPWDSDRGMRLTLERCGRHLNGAASPADNFLAVQRCLMCSGSPWLAPAPRKRPSWVGDKKPFQHTDPALVPFMLRSFPDARFVHVVRHPFAVVTSSTRFNSTRDGDFWLDLSDEEKVERWAFHEQQVHTLRTLAPGRVHTLRYEDLCRRTRAELQRLFAFLGLDADTALLRHASRTTLPSAHGARHLRASDAVRRLALEYGYDVARPPGRARAVAERLWCRVLKGLEG